MNRLLITGATGFIGSHLVRLCVAKGMTVAALVEPDDRMERMGDTRNHIQVIHGGLGECSRWQDVVVRWRPDVCIHLAWHTDPVDYLSSPKNIECLKGSLDLLKVLADAGCCHVVMAGTCLEYRMSSACLVEDGPTEPTTLYGACKLALEGTARQWAQNKGMGFASARIFHLYGPGENPRRLIPAAIEALHGNRAFACSSGEQVRDYLHVEDVASGLLMMTEKSAQGVVNICSGEPVPVRKVLELIGTLTGRLQFIQFGSRPLPSWEPPAIVGHSARLRSLGWQPRYSLREGLSDTLEWWLKQKGSDIV